MYNSRGQDFFCFYKSTESSIVLHSMAKNKTGIFLALLAATLYALCSPVSKVLLTVIPPMMMASLLYLGTGVGMILVRLLMHLFNNNPHENTPTVFEQQPLEKKDLRWFIAIIPLGIFSTLMLTLGINHTTAANASLLNNFEIVATAVIALCLFREKISKRLWIAIAFITVASLILSFENMSSLSFSLGSIFVLLSCVGWGFENNCTKQISGKDPLQIVTIKGCCSGTLTMIIALVSGERMPVSGYILVALALGFVAFGLSNFFYIYAQRKMGAAKTSTYYAVSPFIGTALSFIIFRQMPTATFIVALLIMLVGAFLAAQDSRYL